MAFKMRSLPLSSKQASEDRSMRYYLDTGLLDCPICMEPFSPPVYQCHNGHSICSACCQKISLQKCPTCSQLTGQIRSLMVEKIIESLQVSCKHAPHGCTEMLYYSKRVERGRHEKETCKHKPFPCPYPACSCEGSCFVLPSHLAKAHGVQRMILDHRRHVKLQMSNLNHFMMVDVGDDGLMLVHREQHELGDVFFCTTISGACRVYNLKVKCTAGTSFFTIESSALYIQTVAERSCVSTDRLLILVADFGHPREYDVEVEVRDPKTAPAALMVPTIDDEEYPGYDTDGAPSWW